MNVSLSVGFVGLGAIGLPMAQSIHRAGIALTGVEPFAAARERAEQAGVTTVGDISEIGDVAVVVVMVATASQLEGVIDMAIESDVIADRIWVVMSTIGPDDVKTAAARIVTAGGRVIDAPVSGGIARAGRGELSLFVSGAPEDLAIVDPVLAAMGSARIVGDKVGDGQAVKVVNQHLCAVHIVAAAEALALAQRLDLDPAFVLETIGQGAAESFMLGDRGPRMLQGVDSPVLSQIAIFVKDTGLVSDAAQAAGIELPVLAAARARFLLAEREGLIARDDSSVIETYLGKVPS